MSDISKKSKIRHFSCENCTYKASNKSNFPTKWHLRRHQAAVHEKKKDFDCMWCNYKAGYRHVLRNHMKVVHNKTEKENVTGKHDNNIQCQLCQFEAHTEDGLTDHLMSTHVVPN